MRERPLAHNFARLVEQADLVLCRAPVDASEPAECLISHGPVLSCSTSYHDACRNLYGRSRARLPTGHPSWPVCRGTDPRLVLVARVHGWSLPTGRLARSAYTGTDRALPDTGALDGDAARRALCHAGGARAGHRGCTRSRAEAALTLAALSGSATSVGIAGYWA